MTDQALPNVEGRVYCALAVFLSLVRVAGEAHIRVRLCQQGLVIRRMWIVTADAIPLAHRGMDESFLKFLRIILMTLQAQRSAAFC